MRYVDEFRNPQAARRLGEQIGRAAAATGRTLRFMEVCGGHTMAIHRFGLPHLLPQSVELLSGPGCPVCVTPTTYIDRAVELGREGALLATFGDLYRVPGSAGSLEEAVAGGLDVRIVYSPRDALKIAREEPDRRVVFLGVGFETTAPTVAATMLEARQAGLGNFRVLSGHKTMPRALRALVEAPQVAIDGFILPGHVTAVIGTRPYEFLPREFGTACCVSGFEPTDILMAVLSLTRQCVASEPAVDNQYLRAVPAEGNPLARGIVEQVFEPADSQWRGIGCIGGSGLDIREEWAAMREGPPDPAAPSADFGACRCAEVLRGVIRPPQCPLFGKACVPDSPVGPCMVSSEGSCAAFYKYGPGR
jgi:hydrogenase expression/formation protein HypD